MAAYTTIDDPEAYFQAVKYTGNYTGGGSTQDITLPGDTNMQPDLVWIKSTKAEKHCLYDSVRGATKTLSPNSTAGESTDAGFMTAFNSDGFSVGAANETNENATSIVAWCWKGGTTSGIATTGADITPSAYSFNQTAGISIVTYTGNSSTDQQIAHGLGAVPHFIICKVRDADNAQNWDSYHRGNTAAPETDYLSLNLNNATADAVARWQDTAPTSVLFTVGDAGAVNQTGDGIMAYLFTSIQGYSKFGVYTGNNLDPNGPFAYLGFSPAWVMIKRSDSSDNWKIHTKKVEVFNPINQSFSADTNSGENTETDHEIDFLSNGFKLKENNSAFNASGGSYIFAAFAEAPLVNSKGVPCNAR